MTESSARQGAQSAQGAAADSSRPRQWRLLGAAAALLIAVALLAWLGARLLRPPAPAAPPPPGAFRATAQQLRALGIETVALRDIVDSEVADGRIAADAEHSTPVYSPFSGRVVRIAAQPGDSVASGAPLAFIEASEFAQGQSDFATALAQEKLARASESRRHEQYTAGGASLQDWQQAQAELRGAEAALAATRNRLRILGRSDAEIAALAAQAERGSPPGAAVALRAPLAGVVLDRQLGPGQYLQAGAGPLYTIADLSSVWLVANVREADAARMRRGQAVEVRVPAWPERSFAARISYVAPVIDPLTHRLAVRAVVRNADGALKPEMLASFRIVTGEAARVPAVPESAVVHDGERTHVWVVADPGDVIALREIEVGRSADGWVAVQKGLKPGEKIVTRGALFIDHAARID